MILWVYFVVGLLVGLLAVVIIFLALYRRRIRSAAFNMILPLQRRTRSSNQIVASSSNLDATNFGPRRFSYAELRVATNDFSKDKLLGQGGFGCVYKGVILESPNQKEKIMVAIKRMAKNSKQGEREFNAEVLSIGRLRHRNLASLLGWCHERDELLLVYEFMAKGSLDQHLYHKLGYPTLPWSSRFQILQGIASALEYLHGGWKKCILHRDIKPSNILLDSHMIARLGDFGLARLAGHTIVSSPGLSTGSNIVGGTLGYMAPEVFLYGQLTKKADVYSFGMVALEVVCGRRPPGFHSEDDQDNLVEWVWSAYHKGQLLEVMDPFLHEFPKSSQLQQQVTSVLHLGMLCTLLDPPLRPPTNRLMQALRGDWSISLPPSRWEYSGASAALSNSSGKSYAHYLGARRYSYAELRDGIKGFSAGTHIGKGSYGDVYKGSILDSNENNQDVAIKRVAPNARGEAFHVEILDLIGRSRHRNLVSLLGWCYEQEELLLVYEFMENGFLDCHLHPTDGNTLPWASRFKILQEVAAAVDYIHNGCQPENIRILHRDIKPSNVMLDKHMTAKLADFGLSSLAGYDEMGAQMDSRYTAPELISGGCDAATVKSDVYSFGMMALEMVCEWPLQMGDVRGEENLKWLWRMHERGQLLDVIDHASFGSAFFKQNDTDEEVLRQQEGLGSAFFKENVTDEEVLRQEEGFDFDEVVKQQITRVLQLGMLCCLPEASLRPHSNLLLQAFKNVSQPNCSLLSWYCQEYLTVFSSVCV